MSRNHHFFLVSFLVFTLCNSMLYAGKEKDEKVQFEYLAIRDITVVDSERTLDVCLVNHGDKGELVYDGIDELDHVLLKIPIGPEDDDLTVELATLICTSLSMDWVCEGPELISSADEEDESVDVDNAQEWAAFTIRPDGQVFVENGESNCFRVEFINVNPEMGEVSLLVDQYFEGKRAKKAINDVMEVFKTDGIGLAIKHDDLLDIRADQHHPRYTDEEAFQAVLDRDGLGSGLDADTVDGSDSSELEESAEILAAIAAHAAIPDAHHSLEDGAGYDLDARFVDYYVIRENTNSVFCDGLPPPTGGNIATFFSECVTLDPRRPFVYMSAKVQNPDLDRTFTGIAYFRVEYGCLPNFEACSLPEPGVTEDRPYVEKLNLFTAPTGNLVAVPFSLPRDSDFVELNTGESLLPTFGITPEEEVRFELVVERIGGVPPAGSERLRASDFIVRAPARVLH